MSEEQSTPPPAPEPAPQGGEPQGQRSAQGMSENTWCMVTHLSALSGFVTGVGFILGPLIVWLIKKDELPAVDRHGKEAINFQLSMLLYSIAAGIVGGVLTVILIGFVILLVAGLAYTVMVVVFPILAGLKANEGKDYLYPITIRFLK